MESEAALKNILDDTPYRKLAEALEATRFQAHLLDTVEQSVIATDLDGIVIYWNQFARKLYGWTAEEAVGRQIMDLTTPEMMAEQALEIMSQLRQGNSWAGEFNVQRRDGTMFPVQIINSPINDETGALIGIVGVSVDITERKRQEDSLRALTLQIERQSRVFDTTLSSITDFAYIFDNDGRFVYVNQALLDLWGRTLNDAIGKNFFDLQYPHELAAKLQRQIQQVFETKRGLTDETPYTSPTGKGGYYEYIFSPVLAADGSVEYVAGSTRDITRRKEAEEEREQLLQSIKHERSRILYLFEHSPAFVAVLRGATHVFELVNPPYQRLIGNRDVVGKTAREALPEITDQGYFELLDRVYLTGEPYIGKEMQLEIWRAGALEEVHLNFVYQPIFETDGSVSGIFVHGVDVTDEVKAHREGMERHEFILKKTNAALQAEATARQRVEHERAQLLRRIVFTQEDERRRIAREMHDQLGQQLTALTLKLDALKEHYRQNTQLHEQLEALQAIAGQLDKDVDHMIWEMHPMSLDDLGLQSALSSYTQNWSQHFGVPVQLHASGMDQDRFPSEIETALYRIAQEALNNVAKHAEARSVAVMIERRAGQVSLIIEDDGRGFDLQQVFAADDKGLGLIGMRERATLVGGIIEIESQPGEGATLVVRIPVPPKWRGAE